MQEVAGSTPANPTIARFTRAFSLEEPMNDIDLLTDVTIEMLDDYLDLDTDEQFGLLLSQAEALAERDPNFFATQLARWVYESLDDPERWDQLRNIIRIVALTSPNEVKELFMAEPS